MRSCSLLCKLQQCDSNATTEASSGGANALCFSFVGIFTSLLMASVHSSFYAQSLPLRYSQLLGVNDLGRTALGHPGAALFLVLPPPILVISSLQLASLTCLTCTAQDSNHTCRSAGTLVQLHTPSSCLPAEVTFLQHVSARLSNHLFNCCHL